MVEKGHLMGVSVVGIGHRVLSKFFDPLGYLTSPSLPLYIWKRNMTKFVPSSIL